MMRYTLFIILALVQFVLGSCNLNSSKRQAKDSSILIQSVNVVDAISGERQNMNVLITGNKIVELSNKPIDYPEDCIILNGKGKYLIPGLWDAHVHLTFTPDLEQSMFPLFLANGITSIRDTGGLTQLVLPWKQKYLNEPNSSPRVFIAGPLLDGLPNVYDGSPGRPEISVGIGSIEEAKAIVDTLNTLGVDFVKSYEMLRPELFKTIIDRAREHDLFVTGHVPLSVDVLEASDAGLRSMEHMRNLEMAVSSDFDSLLQDRRRMLIEGRDLPGGKLRSQIHAAQRVYSIETFDEKRASEVLGRLAKNGTWQIPTMALLTGGINRLYENEEWKENFQFLPAKVRRSWVEAAEKAQEQESSAMSIAHGEWALMMIQKFQDAKLRILAGTDTPLAYLTPGFSLHKELEILVEGGLEPIEAIESATRLPAEYFNVQDSIGTIDKNMIADLVLLDANPLSDIRNTRKIRAVIRNGNVYNRKALDSLLKVSRLSKPEFFPINRPCLIYFL